MSAHASISKIAVIWTILLGVLLTPAAFGQLTDATLKGTVTDPSGSVVPRASVVVTNESTGQKRSATSGQSGEFSLSDLAPGPYDVNVSISGFKNFEQRGLELNVGKFTEINVRLVVGEGKQTVKVSAQAAQVPVSTEARLSDTLEHKQIVDLPIPDRDVFFLTSLSAGATNIPGKSFAYKLVGSPIVAVNGNRFRGDNYVLDGSMDTDILNQGEPAIVPSLESINEVQVQTGNFSSEYGRGNGSVVNIQTKSGTNEFHGKIWEYDKNAVLNARNFFAASTPPLVFNQFGANLGGPIRKNKTFFFGTYEGTRDALGQALAYQVETPEYRNYVFNTSPSSLAASLLKKFPAPTPSPGSGGKEYQGEVDLTTPQGAVIPGTGTAAVILHDDLRDDQYMARVDHSFANGKDSLTGRWIADDERNNGASSSGLTSLGQATRGFVDPAGLFFGNLNFGEVHVFDRMVNDARFSFNDDVIGYSTPYAQYPIINITGVTAPFGDQVPLQTHLRTYEARDTLTLTRGRHVLRTGLELRKLFIGFGLGPPAAGTFFFNNLLDFAVDNPFEQVLIVNPATGTLTRTDRDYSSYETGAFVQDDWKATSRLTLNLGVRHDYFGDPSERYGRMSNLTWGSGGTYSERLANASVGHVTQLFDPQKANFSPRAGLAYDPFGDGKSSIRAGYSLAYQPLHERSLLGQSSNPPFDIQAVLQPNVGIGTNILYGIPVPFNPQFQTALNAQGGVVTAPGTPSIRLAVTVDNPNIKTQYSESWFFNIQREVVSSWIVEIGYVGTNGINLERRDDINRVDGDLLDGKLDRINPNFATVTYMTNGVTSSYNALTAEVRHRLGSGLTLQANYRWSKWIDDSSDTNTAAQNDNAEPGKGPENAACLRCERGPSEFDIPQRVTGSALWTPRLSKGNDLLGKIGNNWQISTIIVAQSGRPFSVYCSASYQAGCDFNADGGGGINGGYYDRPDAPAPGAVKSSFSQQDFLSGLFNPNVFPIPTPGTNGTLGRDVYRGPHQVNADLALTRSFRVREGKELQFRFESFNTLNNVNLYIPNDDLALALKPDKTYSTTSSFGKSTRAFDPRILQVSVRFAF
ncbi:MAG TPA: TonB-dependent receptor [Terriglobia bacterium]|nr:TonB-dependent receptor [Terriglobia bacterium]